MTDWKAYALGKPGAWPDEPWEGDLVAKVGDKIFVFLGGSGDGEVTSLGVKCGDREAADEWLLRLHRPTRLEHAGGRFADPR
jgi:predicted DNA-binding protein (MmcQ/YjbR family)